MCKNHVTLALQLTFLLDKSFIKERDIIIYSKVKKPFNLLKDCKKKLAILFNEKPLN